MKTEFFLTFCLIFLGWSLNAQNEEDLIRRLSRNPELMQKELIRVRMAKEKGQLAGPYYAAVHITSDPAGAEVYGIDYLGNREDWGATPKKNENTFLSRIFSSEDGKDMTYTIILEQRDRTKKYSFTVHYKHYRGYEDYSIIEKDAKDIKVIIQPSGSGEEEIIK